MVKKVKAYIKAAIKYAVTISPIRLLAVLIYMKHTKHIKKSMVMICPGGIGDTVISVLLTKSFMDKHKINELVYLIKKEHKDVLKLLGVKHMSIDISAKKMRIMELAFKPFQTKRITKRSKYIYCEMPIKNETVSVGKNFLVDCKENIYLLGQGAILEQYKKLNYCKKSKKIILAPYTVSIKYAGIDIWDGLSVQLKMKGYDVYTNTTDGRYIRGSKILCVNLDEFINELEAYFCVISYRSGLNDLLEVFGARQLILYSDHDTLRYYNTVGLQDSTRTRNIVMEKDIESTIIKIINVLEEVWFDEAGIIR